MALEIAFLEKIFLRVFLPSCGHVEHPLYYDVQLRGKTLASDWSVVTFVGLSLVNSPVGQGPTWQGASC